MKRTFDNIEDVPRYAAVKDAYCDEIEIVEFSDSLREECYEEFKDEDDIDYDEVVEFLGLNTNSNTVLLAHGIRNVKKC